MLMPQADRKKIYEYLFENGVCVAAKDYELKSHPEIKGVKNLYVIKALQSLKSRGYTKEQYAWRTYYFYLTAEGISYLRSYLGIPEDHFPATHYKPSKGEGRKRGDDGARGGGKSDFGDRGGYRTAGGAVDKMAEAGPGAVPPTREEGPMQE